MADKPKFNPVLPFQSVAESTKPKFDPSKPFAPVDQSPPSKAPPGDIPAFPGSVEDVAQKANSKPFSEAPQEGLLDEAKRVVGSVGGTAAKGLAGTAEFLGAGATGTGASLLNLATEATGAQELLKRNGESGTDYLRRNREEHTYAPQTEGGQAIANSPIPAGIGHVVEAGANKASELTNNPAVGETVKDLIGAAPVAAGAKFAKPGAAAEKTAATPVKTKISETPIESTRAAGIKVSAAAEKGVNPGKNNFVARALESVAGPEALNKKLSLKNQPGINRLALDEIGAPKDAKALTDGVLGRARMPHRRTYREAEQAVGDFTPTPEYGTALDSIITENIPRSRQNTFRLDTEHFKDIKSGAEATKKIRMLRDEARKGQNSMQRGDQIRGEAYQKMADALEDEFGRQLEASGDSTMLDKWRSARQSLAKIRDVEDMTVGGQIDAKKAFTLRKAGRPLSGMLAAIADLGEHVPGVTEHSIKAAKGSGGFHGAVSPGLDLLSLGGRPLLREILASDAVQNMRGSPAAKLGPGEGLSDYFPQPKSEPPAPQPKLGPGEGMPPVGGGVFPTSGSAMLEAQKRAGDLSLLDEMANPQVLPEVPSRLTADIPPPVRGDVNFQGSNLADSALDFAPEDFAPGIPGGANPRAAGMSQEVPGTKLFPELRAVRGKPDEVVGENLAISEGPDVGPPAPQGTGGLPEPSPQGPGSPGLDLVADLGIEIVPSANGGFEISVQGQKAGVAFQTAEEARAAAIDIADSLVGGLPDEAPAAPYVAPRNVPNPGGGPADMFDDLFQNNASGESAASVEAINRNAQEKAAGQSRYLIENGQVTPLVGVDAVDAAARPGQVIAQRGVGSSPYTVLDRGGLSKRAAENRIQMVIDLLNGME